MKKSGQFDNTDLIAFFKEHPEFGCDISSLEIPEHFRNNKAVEEMIRTKATTVISALYKDGVIMACDRRATAIGDGYAMIMDPRVKKIGILDKQLSCGISGVKFLGLYLLKMMKVHFYNTLKKNDGTPLPFDTKVHMISAFLQELMPLAMQGLVVVPIIAGYDAKRDKFRIMDMDPAGDKTEMTDLGYTLTGSGKSALGTTPETLVYCGWDPATATRKETLNKIAYMLISAQWTDPASGCDITRGIYPQIVDINRSGSREIPDEEVKKIYDSVISTIRKK